MAKKNAVVLESGEKIESIGPWTIAWRKFKQNRVAMAGLIIFVLIVVAVIVTVPVLFPVTYPFESTSAIFSLLLVHVISVL